MVGSVASSSSSSSARGSHSVDRFYNPPQRRQLQLQQKQQQQQEQEQHQKQQQQILKPIRPRPKRIPPTSPGTKVEAREVENQIESSHDSPSKLPTMSSYPCSSLPLRPLPPVVNLDRFIHYTTPIVPVRSSYKTVSRDWMHPDALELLSYFSLEDLWESFRKWSAYGAEVPLVLDGSQDIVQYYVPYLSGIQLYVNSNPKPRHLGEHGDGKSYRDMNNEGSSADVCGSHQKINEKWSKVALFCNTHAGIEGHASDSDKIQNSHLAFEYFENSPPHLREPLADKVSVLASQFPQLKIYTSCDLLPSSWISVAWYPIYRIPACLSMQDLDTSFLTFHSLAIPSKCTPNGFPDPCYVRNRNETKDISTKLSLPIFGLASYKFRSFVWNPDGLSKQDPPSLLQAADEWLRLLQVEHPDYNFFSEKHRNFCQR